MDKNKNKPLNFVGKMTSVIWNLLCFKVYFALALFGKDICQTNFILSFDLKKLFKPS